MLEQVYINVAKDFALTPSGRNASDGPNNGTRFRDELLIPALQNNRIVVVCLDGTEGFGSSFLEEAFGGLLRSGFSLGEIEQRLRFDADSPSGKKYMKRIKQVLNLRH